jgi:hypothetical protein
VQTNPVDSNIGHHHPDRYDYADQPEEVALAGRGLATVLAFLGLVAVSLLVIVLVISALTSSGGSQTDDSRPGQSPVREQPSQQQQPSSGGDQVVP